VTQTGHAAALGAIQAAREGRDVFLAANPIATATLIAQELREAARELGVEIELNELQTGVAIISVVEQS
jgi:hypothetical protein